MSQTTEASDRGPPASPAVHGTSYIERPVQGLDVCGDRSVLNVSGIYYSTQDQVLLQDGITIDRTSSYMCDGIIYCESHITDIFI